MKNLRLASRAGGSKPVRHVVDKGRQRHPLGPLVLRWARRGGAQGVGQSGLFLTYATVHPELPSERIVKNIRRATRKRHSSEEKIRIVLDGLRGESSIAELCRREGIAEGLYYAWSKEFLEAGKRRLAGDTARAATSGEVKDLRRQAQELKAVVAEQALELRLLKKSMIADGGDEE